MLVVPAVVTCVTAGRTEGTQHIGAVRVRPVCAPPSYQRVRPAGGMLFGPSCGGFTVLFSYGANDAAAFSYEKVTTSVEMPATAAAAGGLPAGPPGSVPQAYFEFVGSSHAPSVTYSAPSGDRSLILSTSIARGASYEIVGYDDVAGRPSGAFEVIYRSAVYTAARSGVLQVESPLSGLTLAQPAHAYFALYSIPPSSTPAPVPGSAKTCGLIGDSIALGEGSPDGATWWGGLSGVFTGALYSPQVGCTNVRISANVGKGYKDSWQPSSVATPSSQAYVRWARPASPCDEAFIAFGTNDAPLVGNVLYRPAIFTTPAPSSSTGLYEGPTTFTNNATLLINAVEDACDSAHAGNHTASTAVPVYLIVPIRNYYFKRTNGSAFAGSIGELSIRSLLFGLIGISEPQPTWSGLTYTNLPATRCPPGWSAASSMHGGTYNGGTGYGPLGSIHVIDVGCDPTWYEADGLTRWPQGVASTATGQIYFCWNVHPCDAGYERYAADIEAAFAGNHTVQAGSRPWLGPRTRVRVLQERAGIPVRADGT